MQTKKTVKQDGELIYGINPVIELLKAKKRPLITLYTTKPTPKSWDRIEKLLEGKRVNIQYITRDALAKLANTTDHQGVVAWAKPFVYRKKFFEPTKHKHLVLLDGIQDTRNLGAILRSAYCTNFDGVILLQKGAAPLNAAALKASAGLAEHLDIYVTASAATALQELKNAGYQVYTAAFKGENVTKTSFTDPLCIVIGSEGVGISSVLLKAGIQITLPQKQGQDISYNASVAAGILLFLVGTQKQTI